MLINISNITHPLILGPISRIYRSMLWSSSKKLLKIPKRNLKSFGERSVSVSSLHLFGIRCLPVCKISTLCLRGQNHAQDFPLYKGLFINLGRHSCDHRLSVCLRVHVCAWMVCASALRFCFVKKICALLELAIIIVIIAYHNYDFLDEVFLSYQPVRHHGTSCPHCCFSRHAPKKQLKSMKEVNGFGWLNPYSRHLLWCNCTSYTLFFRQGKC